MAKHLRFLFLTFSFLTGCSFTPGINAQTARELAHIRVLPIAERQGQLLNTALRRELNPDRLTLESRYILDLSVTTSLAISL